MDITLPENETEFQEFCTDVARTEPGVRDADVYGRTGQTQHGIDVFVNMHDGTHWAIQCKAVSRFDFDKHVLPDLAKAKALPFQISRLVFATTSTRSVQVDDRVIAVNKDRQKAGDFVIEIWCSERLKEKVRSQPSLHTRWAPHLPGSEYFYDRVGIHAKLDSLLKQVKAEPNPLSDLALADLNEIRKLLNSGFLDDAVGRLKKYEAALGSLPPPHRALYLSIRGHALYRKGDRDAGFKCLLDSYATEPDSERGGASNAYVLLQTGKCAEAIVFLNDSLLKNPASELLWTLWLNAHYVLDREPDLSTITATCLKSSSVNAALVFHKVQQNDPDAALVCADQIGTNGANSLYEQYAYAYAMLATLGREGLPSGRYKLAKVWRERLETAIRLFKPFELSVLGQDRSDLAAESGSLCVWLFMFLDLRDEAQALSDQLVNNFPQSARLMSQHVVILAAAGKHDRVVQFAKDTPEKLETEAVCALADAATETADESLYGRCLSIVKASSDDASYSHRLAHVESLSGWLSFRLRGVGGVREWLDHLSSRDPSFEVHHCITAARLAEIALKDRSQTEIWTLRAFEACQSSHPARIALPVCELLVGLGRYDLAVCLLEPRLNFGMLGPVERMALRCYAKLDHRRPAFRLVEALWAAGIHNDELRGLRCQIAWNANDWHLVSDHLAQMQSHENSTLKATHAKLQLLELTGDASGLADLVSKIPLVPSSEAETAYALAFFESRYGYHQRALERMYRHYRCNLGSAEAYGYLTTVLLSTPIEAVTSKPLVVAPGVAFVYEVDRIRTCRCIDPEGILAPSSADFLPASDRSVQPFLGGRVGDRISVSTGLSVKTAKILELRHCYEFAMEHGRNLIKDNPGNEGPIWAVDAPKAELDKFVQTLIKSGEDRKERQQAFLRIFATQKLLPLGFAAKKLGVPLSRIIHAWREVAEVCPLDVGEIADSELVGSSRICAIDLPTLALIHDLGLESILDGFEKVYVPNSVIAQIKTELVATDHALGDPAGTLTSERGKLILHEAPGDARETSAIRLEQILTLATSKCCAVPVYGPESLPSIWGPLVMSNLWDFHSEDVVLLCAEKGIPLLTLDARLAGGAKAIFDIGHISFPQMIIEGFARTGGEVDTHFMAHLYLMQCGAQPMELGFRFLFWLIKNSASGETGYWVIYWKWAARMSDGRHIRPLIWFAVIATAQARDLPACIEILSALLAPVLKSPCGTRIDNLGAFLHAEITVVAGRLISIERCELVARRLLRSTESWPDRSAASVFPSYQFKRPQFVSKQSA